MPLLVALVACSSAVEPASSVTLLVRNATCDPGPCQAIRVLAFPQNQPLTPGGPWKIDLGVVSGAQACLTVPATTKFTVTDAGTGASTVTTWTSRDSLSLASWPPSTPLFMANPATASFVPGNSGSWIVTLPGTAAPIAASTCAPL